MGPVKFSTVLEVSGRSTWWKKASPIERRAFLVGSYATAEMWAWWKDGVQYVGSCGTRLKDMLDALNSIDPETGKKKER